MIQSGKGMNVLLTLYSSWMDAQSEYILFYIREKCPAYLVIYAVCQRQAAPSFF